MKDKVFPSISICPKYAYKDWFRVFKFNDTELLKPKLYSHIWKRNETFYYVDYPNKNNSGFECMTEKSSSDPGKPCRFPYNHVDDPNISTHPYETVIVEFMLILVVDECLLDPISNYTYCKTKIFENGTAFVPGLNFGICKHTCKGNGIIFMIILCSLH